MEKKKVLMLTDSILSFSGVGLQSRFVAEALVKSGKYKIFNLAGAIKHTDYKPIKTNEYGDDLIIQPVDGYGSPEILRSLVRGWKPDVIWFMTDPRFWEWLWQMEDEIRPLVPTVFYTIWDNYPIPLYNKVWYESTDHLVAISKVTHEIVKTVAPNVDSEYLPHAVNTEIFKALDKDVVAKLREDNFKGSKDKTIFFFNSRNARRKMTGSLVWWFKTFLDRVGQDKAMLVMHTNPKDEHGPDLDRLAKDRGLTKDQILFSTDKVDFPQLAALYNMADCTINIADAEGFGLCLEPNTDIDTIFGQKTLADISVGDEVLAEDGLYHKVKNKSSRKAETLKISVAGCKPIISSFEHPFLALDEKTGEQNWKRADELKSSGFVATPRMKDSSELVQKIDILDYIDKDRTDLQYDDSHIWCKMGFTPYSNGMSISEICEKFGVTKHYAENARLHALGTPSKRHGNRELYSDLIEKLDLTQLNNQAPVKVKRFVEVNDEFLQFIGWYLAEGSAGGGKFVEFNLHCSELPVAEKLLEDSKKLFGIERGNVETYDNSCRLIFSSSIMADFLRNVCGDGAKNKKVPEFLIKTPSKLLPLAHCLIEGDGHEDFQLGKISFVSISKTLSWQLKQILSNHGIYTGFKTRKHNNDRKLYKKTPQDTHEVTMFGNNYVQYKNLLGEEVEQIFLNKRKHNNNIVTDDFIFCRVRKIEKGCEEIELMDIEVEDVHSFIANGVVVHNCALESLACETPAIVTMTGGLQEQITDGVDFFGVGIEPVSKAIIGSQQVPYIFEDRICEKDFVNALEKIHNMSPSEREELGRKGRQHVLKNYNFEEFGEKWVNLMDRVVEKHGSWETRKGYKTWECKEIK